MSIKLDRVEARLKAFSALAQVESETALLHLFGAGKAPGKVVEGMSDRDKHILFTRSLAKLGFKIKINGETTGSGKADLWEYKGQGGPWIRECIVGKRSFAFRAVRKQKGERDMNNKRYRAEIPARSPQDMYKYVKWVLAKTL